MPLPRLLALSNLDKWHLLQFLGFPSWKCWEWQLSAAKESHHPEPGMAVGKPGQYNCDESQCCSWTQQGVGTDLLPAVTLRKWLLVFLPYGLDPVSTGNRKTNFPFSVSSHLLSSIDVAKFLAPASDARCLRLVCLILGNDSNKGPFLLPCSTPLLHPQAPSPLLRTQAHTSSYSLPPSDVRKRKNM